jgi:hypothetical protein
LSEYLFARTFRVIVRRIKEVDATVNRRLDQFIGPGLINRADALDVDVRCSWRILHFLDKRGIFLECA